jgi:hypothetical protein
VWTSSQKWSVQRSALRSIAWLDLLRDHPAAFHSGRPENFAGISARHFNGVEHQRRSAAGEGRTGVIATGVIGEWPQLSENGGEMASRKVSASENRKSVPANA